MQCTFTVSPGIRQRSEHPRGVCWQYLVVMVCFLLFFLSSLPAFLFSLSTRLLLPSILTTSRYMADSTADNTAFDIRPGSRDQLIHSISKVALNNNKFRHPLLPDSNTAQPLVPGGVPCSRDCAARPRITAVFCILYLYFVFLNILCVYYLLYSYLF